MGARKKGSTFTKPLIYEPASEDPFEDFLKNLERGNSLKISADGAGYPLANYYKVKSLADKGDPDASAIFARVEQARARSVIEHMKILREAALEGDWKASLEWLKAFQKEEFTNDQKLTIEHKMSETLDVLFQQIRALIPEDMYTNMMEALKMSHLLGTIQDAEIIVTPELPESTDPSGDE